jgi:hypothetical protein
MRPAKKSAVIVTPNAVNVIQVPARIVRMTQMALEVPMSVSMVPGKMTIAVFSEVVSRFPAL